jgi:O-antigen ligase
MMSLLMVKLKPWLKSYNAVLLSAALLGPIGLLASNWLAGIGPISAVIAGLAWISGDAAAPPYRSPQPMTALLLFLTAWSVVCVAWTPPGSTAYEKSPAAVLLLLGVIPMLHAAANMNADQARRLTKVLGVALCIGAVLALDYRFDRTVHNAIRGALGMESGWRITGANRALDVMAIIVWPAVYGLWRTGRSVLALAAVALVTAAIATGVAVAAKLALMVGGAVFMLTLVVGQIGARAASIALGLIVFAMPLLPLTVLRPELHHAWLAGSSPSGMHRLYIWKFVADHIVRNPLWGYGFEASRVMPGGRDLAFSNWQNLPLHPHNASLQIWLELGLPGAAAFAALIVAVGFVIARIQNRAARAVGFASFLAAMLPLMLSFGVWQEWWLGALGMCAMLAAMLLGGALRPALAPAGRE